LQIFHLLPESLRWLYALTVLVSFVFGLVLLFTPGTQGDNRFGSLPPPNSGWVVFGAWSFLIVPFFGGILAAIAIPAYRDYIARAQTSEAIQLAGGAEQTVSAYHAQNKAWPTDLSPLYPKNPDGGIGLYSAGITAVTVTDGSSFGIMVTMKQTGVAAPIASKGVEIWTKDGGSTWLCGPASMDPVDPKYLPASCRSTDAL
jgi:type II secretory pathway pseudopilin PulG